VKCRVADSFVVGYSTDRVLETDDDEGKTPADGSRTRHEQKGGGMSDEERFPDEASKVSRKEGTTGDDVEGHVLRRKEDMTGDDVEGHLKRRREDAIGDDVEGHLKRRREDAIGEDAEGGPQY
jgi:hypothetical protein